MDVDWASTATFTAFAVRTGSTAPTQSVRSITATAGAVTGGIARGAGTAKSAGTEAGADGRIRRALAQQWPEPDLSWLERLFVRARVVLSEDGAGFSAAMDSVNILFCKANT